jgi:hypothetical protein
MRHTQAARPIPAQDVPRDKPAATLPPSRHRPPRLSAPPSIGSPRSSNTSPRAVSGPGCTVAAAQSAQQSHPALVVKDGLLSAAMRLGIQRAGLTAKSRQLGDE